MIVIWRGFHHYDLQKIILETWNSDDLLVVCPPHISENKFEQFQFLPPGKIKYYQLKNSLSMKLEYRKNSTWEGRDAPKLAVFTSGSTGGDTGRLIFYTKENILLAIEKLYSLFCLENIKQIYCFPQPFHCFGLLIGYYFSFLYQKKIIFTEGPYSAASLIEWIDTTNENTITLGVPTHFKDLIAFTKKFKAPVKESYGAVLSSAKVNTELWHDVRDVLKIHYPCISYGTAETSGAITNLAPGTPPLCDGDIGTLVSSAKINPCPKGGFFIEGPNVCLAIATQSEIQFPQKIHVKDHLEYDDNRKTYFYKGRIDFEINRAGTKLLIEDIESFLSHFLKLPFALGAYRHPRLGEEIIIYSEAPIQNFNLNTLDLQKKLFDHFKVSFEDALYVQVEKIPKNPSGKINRKALMQNPSIEKALPLFKKEGPI